MELGGDLPALGLVGVEAEAAGLDVLAGAVGDLADRRLGAFEDLGGSGSHGPMYVSRVARAEVRPFNERLVTVRSR